MLKIFPDTKTGFYRALLLLLFSVVLALYANSLGNDFVFDDISLVVENESIRSVRNLAEFFPTKRNLSGYRPVRFLSYLLDYQLFGLKPEGFRFSNLCYHTINGLMVFILAQMIGLNLFGAFCCSLFFLTHPLQTESVAYISGRRDLLFTLFYLIAFFCYVRHYQRLNLKASLIVIGLMLLAFFSKEMAASLPLMIVWYALWFELNDRSGGGEVESGQKYLKSAFLRVCRKAAFFIVILVVLTVLFIAYKLFFWRPTAQPLYWGGNILTNFLTVAQVWVYYFGLIVLPIPLKGDYSAAAFPIVTEIGEILPWLCVLLILAYLIVSLKLVRKRPIISFGCIWFAIALLPVSHIFPHHELMAEHYLYMPLIGFGLCFGWLLDCLYRQGSARLAASLLIVLVVLYAGRVMIRNEDWRDSFQFWLSAVRFEPLAARACLNVAVLYDQKGNETKFLEFIERSISAKPSARALYNLAIYWQDKKQHEKAIVLYQQAMELDLNFSQPYFNLGFLYKSLGEYDLALQTFEAFNGYDTDPGLLFASGVTRFEQGQPEAAMSLFLKANQLDETYEGLHYYLGQCYLASGDCQQARLHFRKEIERRTRFQMISQSSEKQCLKK